MLIIDQLSRGRWMWLVTGGAVAAASVFSGCSGGFDSCTADKNCGPYDGGGGGAGSAGNAEHGGSGAGAGQSGAGAQGGSGSGAGGVSGMAGSAGEAGAAGSGVVPCDTTKTPTEEACLVSDAYAVFVAPNGKDTAAGTMEAPFATLTNAITMAGGSKFVIVCDATYDEHVVVGDGAVVYGGFSCTGGKWATEAGAPLFKPSDAGPALKIDGVSKSVAIETVNFEVPDAKVPGGTALAALVNASPSVTLRNVSLTAGAGMDGADGTLELFSYVPQASLNGDAESAAGVGGAEKDCACQATLMSVGGGGGPPASSGQAGAKGGPDHSGGQPGTPDNNDCATGGTGKKGGDATAASASSGATTLGTLSGAGWQPTSGVDGANGSPGQGGGGGASLNNQGHGGGGGCGGCGGNGAKAGQGGGGSIALVAFDSPVVLDGCILAAKDAGSGGAGHAGQPGQTLLGAGGSVVSSINSCPGGNGGKGGDGAASGGGAGGVSAGIVWKGANAPTVTNTTTTTGKAGAQGIGGVPATNDGIAGVKQDTLQVP